jgi:DNA-binding Lrp family transcriptional regulator
MVSGRRKLAVALKPETAAHARRIEGCVRSTMRGTTVEGYILIHTEMGKMEAVAEAVASLDGVETTETVTGPYDVVARARRSCEHDLVHCLEQEIAGIPGVTRVVACPLASHDRVWEMGLEPAGHLSTGEHDLELSHP